MLLLKKTLYSVKPPEEWLALTELQYFKISYRLMFPLNLKIILGLAIAFVDLFLFHKTNTEQKHGTLC